MQQQSSTYRSFKPSVLFGHLQEAFRVWRGRRPSPARRSALIFEPIEQRLLLDGVLEYAVTDIHEVVVEVNAANIEIVDNMTNTVLASQVSAETTAIRVIGSAGNDLVVVDSTVAALDKHVEFRDASPSDSDELAVFGPAELDWAISGLGTGFVDTAGGLLFSGVEKLRGDTGNRDRFDLGGAGAVQTIEANGGGFDTLLLESAQPVTLTDALITAGSRSITIAGFESAVVAGGTLNAAGFTAQVAQVSGVPTWESDGPGSLDQGQVKLNGPDLVAGAVQDVALRPFDLSSLYIGTVGGGVWKNSDISVLFGADGSTLDSNAQTRLADT